MDKEVIRLDHISKQFNQTPVLKDITAKLHKGEILGFLGPSGAGKTTTIKIITGQLHQTSGEAYILGINSKQIDETIYEQIGIVTDTSGVYDYVSVYQNLEMFAKILGVKKINIEEILKKVDLWEHRQKLASKLSKGQTQRLILARAILHHPRVLFLDEPTSGLDPSTAMEIHKLLKQLKEEGMAIFLTTHNMEEATKLCDYVALLNNGTIVEYGTPEELCLKYNQQKKYKIKLRDGNNYLMEQNPENSNQISKWLIQEEIETIHSCEPTLETVFLEVTGRELS